MNSNSKSNISINKFYPNKNRRISFSLVNSLMNYFIIILLIIISIFFSFKHFTPLDHRPKSPKLLKDNNQAEINNQNDFHFEKNVSSCESFPLKYMIEDSKTNSSFFYEKEKNFQPMTLNEIQSELKVIELPNEERLFHIIEITEFRIKLKKYFDFNKRRPRFWKYYLESLLYRCSKSIKYFNPQDLEIYYTFFLNIPKIKLKINKKYSDDFIYNNNKFCSRLTRGNLFLKTKKLKINCIILHNLTLSNFDSNTKLIINFFLYQRVSNTNRIVLSNKISKKINYIDFHRSIINSIDPDNLFMNDVDSNKRWFRFCNIFNGKNYYESLNLMIKFKIIQQSKTNICFDNIYGVNGFN